jgi:ubiquinol-cytochrome c reductase cytochrome c1 subunit
MVLLPTLARASLAVGFIAALSGAGLAADAAKKSAPAAATATPAATAKAPAAAATAPAATATAPAAPPAAPAAAAAATAPGSANTTSEVPAQATAPETAASPTAEAKPEGSAAAQAAGAGGGTSSTPVAPAAVPPPAQEPKSVTWSFDGPFGKYDRASLQRGYQVYKEICSACHSLNRIAFRNLADKGGPGFTAAEVKALAAGAMIPAEPNDEGKTYDDSGTRLTRPGIPSDYFPAPFENEKAARSANAGALPPDLSVIVKAREGHSNYVYSILTGFTDPPAGFAMADNMYFNPYFAGHQIAMPPPLKDAKVDYADGTNATPEQMAHDVVTFLTWASEPKMEERKELGFMVMIFLLVLTSLLFLSYRRLWHDQH